jgi:translation initiation factor IF-2
MQLLSEGLELEEYGGDVQLVQTAARKGIGLDALEEALLLQVSYSTASHEYAAQLAGNLRISALVISASVSTASVDCFCSFSACCFAVGVCSSVD